MGVWEYGSVGDDGGKTLKKVMESQTSAAPTG